MADTHQLAGFNKSGSSKIVLWVCLAQLAGINALFTYKFALRINSHALLITAVYTAGFLSIPFFFSRAIPAKYQQRNLLYVLLLLYCLLDIVFLWKSDPMKLNVDRWSVITSFWDFFLSGRFPYMAKSHLGNAPGPFPFYFLLAFPFYLIHEIGYFSLIGVLLMLVFIFRQKTAVTKQYSTVFLLLISTSILWEVTTRSTMLVNATLVLLYAYWLLNVSQFTTKSLIWAGIAGGLLLSTRSLALIPLVVIYTQLFVRERKWTSVFIIGISMGLAFALTLAPFVLWNYRLFMTYNPITLQGDFLPGPVIPVFLLICVGLGLLIRQKQQLYFYCGLMLFLIMAIYFVYRMITVSPRAYLDNKIDISYFIFCMPFLFAALSANSSSQPATVEPGRLSSVAS